MRNLFNKIKWFIQRGKNGYASCDVWNLDYYLSSWLPRALKELRDMKSSFPWNHGMTDKKWYNLLTKMAKGFESMDEVPRDKWIKEDKKRRLYREIWAFWFWSLWD